MHFSILLGGELMRLKLSLKLEDNVIDIDYRRFLLSFIKLALSTYDKEYFNNLYEEGANKIKPFTFSAFLPNPTFSQDKISLAEKYMNITISFNDYATGVMFYNSFNQIKFKKFPLKDNNLTLVNISLLNEKEINDNTVKISFLSPLVVRDRNRETQKDMYYSFEQEKFNETLLINLREQLKYSDILENVLNDFSIKPILPKKVIVKFYEKNIECSIGTFELSRE